MPVVTVTKPRVIILDLCGTAIKSHFVEKILIGYLRDHLKDYLKEAWDRVTLMNEIKHLKQQVTDDRENDAKIPDINGEIADEERQTIYDNIMYYVNNGMESPAHQAIKFSCWFDAYRNYKITTPIYSDVAKQLKKWKMDYKAKIFVFSNGWVEAQKIFLSNSNQGDLSFLIDGYFDSDTAGDLNKSSSYKKILENVRVEPEECLLLTKSGQQADAASDAGIRAVLVLTHKQDMKKQKKQHLERFPRIRTFNELQFEELPQPQS